MITETITFEDYAGNQATETLSFHVSRAELMDHLDLETRFSAILDSFQTNADAANDPAVRQEIVNLVKFLVDLSYGVRSEDGSRFRKSSDILDNFKSSAAYDEFFFSLFENPQKAVKFMHEILPAKLRETIRSEAEATESTTPAGLMTSDVNAEILRLTQLRDSMTRPASDN